MSAATEGNVGSPFSFPGFQSAAGAFVTAPDLTVSIDEKKKREFGIKFAQGLEMIYLSQGATFGGVAMSAFNTTAQNYMYARGAQPFSASTAPIENFSQNDFQTVGGADTSNTQLLPAILDAVVGKLIKRKMRPQVTLMDAMARNEKLDFRTKLEMLLEVKRQQGEIATFLQQFQMSEDEIPLDVEELEMRVSLMPQFVLEMNMELALRDVGRQSGVDVLDKQILMDLLISDRPVGFFVNRKNGKRQLEKISPVQFFQAPSLYEDGRDVQWRGRIRMVSLEALRAEAAGREEDGKIPDEELKKLKGGQFNILAGSIFQWNPYNSGSSTTYASPLYTDQALVIDFEFLSTDILYVNEKGERLYSQYKPKKQGVDGNVMEVPIQNLFSGSYICGGNGLIYDYGIVEDAVRQPIITGAQYLSGLPMEPSQDQMMEAEENAMFDAKLVNAQKVYSNFVTYQPNMIEGVTRSFIARAIPHIRDLEIIRRKFNKFVEEFLPWMTVIDQDSLAKIVIDDNGNTVSAEEALATVITTGKIIGSSSNLRGLHTASFKEAFQIVANSGGANLSMLWDLFLKQIALVREMLGVSSVDIGVAPGGDQGKAVTEMQAAGTENVLNGIVFARDKLHEALWENLMWDILNTGAIGVMEGKPYMIPEGNPEERILNLIATPLPSEYEWADFFNKANEAIAAKTLTLENYAMLKTLESPKQAWAYLMVYTKRNEIKMAANQSRIDEANTQRQMASNAQAHQNKINEISRQNISKITEIGMQGMVDLIKIAAQPLAEGQKQSLDLQKSLDEIKNLIFEVQNGNTRSDISGGADSLQPIPGDPSVSGTPATEPGVDAI